MAAVFGRPSVARFLAHQVPALGHGFRVGLLPGPYVTTITSAAARPMRLGLPSYVISLPCPQSYSYCREAERTSPVLSNRELRFEGKSAFLGESPVVLFTCPRLYSTAGFKISRTSRTGIGTMPVPRRCFSGYSVIVSGSDLQALLDRYPDYVVKRYESGGFATNTECDGIYRQALTRVGKGKSWRPSTLYTYRPDGITPGPIFPSQSLTSSSRMPGSGDARPTMTGMKGSPVHVVIDEGTAHCSTG
jgi:hypothetical protein